MFYKYVVKGIVQGVGFRPYIYKKAIEYGLKGYVKNIGSGVEIVVNNSEFIKKLENLPALAKINSSNKKKVNGNWKEFSILKSTIALGATILPADIFMCEDCLKELREVKNRRHGYYFITCTNCGPRFSMIKDYPYDRPFTAMNNFKMCSACKQEYTNPLDRRYHAQTIACEKCGPKLELKKDGKKILLENNKKIILKTAMLLQQGEVVAIKGVGGYHLSSIIKKVTNIRSILNRPHKPFAIMVKNITEAKKIAIISEKEQELLESSARPIVICEKKNKNELKEVSELHSIGIMLPYTALHYLIFDHISEPIVMTSCNVPDDPVLIDTVTEGWVLDHEREIINRCDDSVLKVINGDVAYLRRSRGYVPIPVLLPHYKEEIIAIGAELNNVIAIVKDEQCFLSQHIGNCSKEKTSKFMEETVKTFSHLTRVKPTKIICDLHPKYDSTLLGKKLSLEYNCSLKQVQHHKAHVASVAAEHNLKDYVGIAIDGLGYGEDDTIWGGEIFSVSDNTQFIREGHLELQNQLGDAAALEPKKMLLGILQKFLSIEEINRLKLYEKNELQLLYNALKEKFNVIQTSSTGRVLDAAAALLGICTLRTYDGRPAILLESYSAEKGYELESIIIEKEGKKILMTTPLFEFLVKNLDKDKQKLARTVHEYLMKGFYFIASSFANGRKIVCSGGVAYNSIIRSYLQEKGVLFNIQIPSGDGGICYGQAHLGGFEK